MTGEKGQDGWTQVLPSSRRIRLALRRGIPVAAVAMAIAFVSGLFGVRPEPAVATGALDSGLRLNFGLSREAISRSLRIDICDPSGGRGFAECTSSEAARPEVEGVTLVSDLTDERSGQQFPATQIVLNATNVGSQGLLVTVSADPQKPDDVESGEFKGNLIIDRSDGSSVKLGLTAKLRTRTGSPTHRAITALLLGALAGTVLRWTEASFTPLATLRRRQRRLELYLRRHLAGLPDGVKHRLDDVKQAIGSFDPEGVAGTLDQIVQNQDALVAFSAGLIALERSIEDQEELAGDRPGSPVVDEAINVERDFVDQLRHRIWPWDKAEEVTASLDAARGRFRELTGAIRHAARSEDESVRARLTALASRIVEEGPEGLSRALDQTLDVADHAEAAPESIRLRAMRRSDGDLATSDTTTSRSFSIWLLDNAWWLTLATGAAVVAFIGFQQQFLDNAGFEGDVSDYVKLAAWAFAIQVAGGTIIETVGKLTSSVRPGVTQ